MKPARLRFVFGLLLLAGGTLLAQQQLLRDPDVPFEPSPPRVVELMLKLAEVGKDDVVFDLGCGNGQIVIRAARAFGARGVGIDIDPQRIKESIDNAREAGVLDRVSFRNEDLFEASISQATVVTLFLWPEVNLKLRPKLLRELKPGTRVVSYIWDMGDWAPAKQVKVDDRRSVYLWVVPSGSTAPAR